MNRTKLELQLYNQRQYITLGHFKIENILNIVSSNRLSFILITNSDIVIYRNNVNNIGQLFAKIILHDEGEMYLIYRFK